MMAFEVSSPNGTDHWSRFVIAAATGDWAGFGVGASAGISGAALFLFALHAACHAERRALQASLTALSSGIFDFLNSFLSDISVFDVWLSFSASIVIQSVTRGRPKRSTTSFAAS
jgi:hypothetical protein